LKSARLKSWQLVDSFVLFRMTSIEDRVGSVSLSRNRFIMRHFINAFRWLTVRARYPCKGSNLSIADRILQVSL